MVSVLLCGKKGGHQWFYLFYIFTPISFTKEAVFSICFELRRLHPAQKTLSEKKRGNLTCNWCLFCLLNGTSAFILGCAAGHHSMESAL